MFGSKIYYRKYNFFTKYRKYIEQVIIDLIWQFV